MSAYKRKLNTAKLFILLISETSTETKRKQIVKCLDEGANVNEQFVDDSNNTPLHISVINGDIDIVNLLLQRGANVNYKNIENKTAFDVARELDSDNGRAIIELLEAYEAETQADINGVTELDATTDILSIVKRDEIDPKLVYAKRAIETGIKGHFYESKLLSLVLIRASLSQEFDEFYLGTNLDGIGALDDVCIRYKNASQEGVVFVQAKHRNDVNKCKVTLQDLWRDDGDFSLQKYYNSYSMIREKMWVTNEDDVFFKGKYDDLKCTFVIYTTAECDFQNKVSVDVDSIDKTARDLINTGDYSDIFRYNYSENDVSLLTSMLVIDHMKYVGKRLAYFILNGKYDMLMSDPRIRRYHVILARNVINVSDKTPAGYRVGTFRKDFFNNHDAKLLTLKLVLYKEFVLAKKPNEKKMKEIIEAVKTDPTEQTISRLMQNALTRCDDNKILTIIDDRFKDVTIQRFRFDGNYELCFKAFDNAVYEMLGTISFKLPSTFGNIDIAVSNGKKGESRLVHIAEKIEQLYDCTRTEPVIIEPGLVDLNGGLGSAVGNLLILNEQKTGLVLNTDEKTLGKNAQNLLGKLKSRIKDINVVMFNPELFSFPTLTLDGNEIGRRNVRTFFNNLWYYTGQAKEEEIEIHAKDAIQDYCVVNEYERRRTASKARYDAIYFIVHDEVQKWWMADQESCYLTNNREYFDRLLIKFSGKSLLNVVSCMFVNRMRKYGVKFTKDAVDCLISQIGPEATVVISEVRILTGIKLAQCYPNLNRYAFVDLNDVTCLSRNDYDTIVQELKETMLKTLVILYEDVTEAKTNIFYRLTEKSVTKNYILVTNEKAAVKLQLDCTTLRDERNYFNDLDLISQEKVLESLCPFQGVLTNLSKIITTHGMRNLIKPKILQRFINCESIIIGKTLSNPYYEDIKHYYIHRSLNRQDSAQVLKGGSMERNGQNIKITTLEALKDTVIIVGAPGMGKSTFLTYLSIQTKQQNPSLWIERVNLLDQTKELFRLQENKIEINKIDALKFVCKAALSRNLIRFSITPKTVVNFDLEIINGKVVLTNCNDIDYQVLFELELFIHFYNAGNTILLFDGFDEICPHYKNEMMEILKCLVTRYSSDTGAEVKQRMWITGRSYNNIRETLETEFGVSYNLNIFTNDEQEDFIKKYLKINMDLNELDIEHFNGIDGFFDFMKQFIDDYSIINSKKIIKITSYFLYSLYKTAMKYFYVEINKPQIPGKKAFCDKWSIIFNSKSSCYVTMSNETETSFSNQYLHRTTIEEAISMIFTPLHIYIVLESFQNRIKTNKSRIDRDISMKWDLEANTSSFYEDFIETKLKKIRFEEKNQMDLYNPDIIMTYEKELKEFMDKHKKLAFYATFKDDFHDILSEKDVEEIRETIENMERGREKTGVVDCILSDGTPKFVHFSFQEYLAAEYISDLLKTGQIEHVNLWRFVLSKTRAGVLDFIDRKLEFDDELANIITDEDVKLFIFDELTLDRAKYVQGGKRIDDGILDSAINSGAKHTVKMLLKAMSDVVNDSNLDRFIEFINKYQFFYFGANFGWDEVSLIILQCIRRIDASKLIKCQLGILQTHSYRDFSNKDIIKDIKWQILKDNNRVKRKKIISKEHRKSI